MTKNTPDIQQREHALNPAQSFIVQAPAGSGKTSLLIQRYLVLLARAQKTPEEILAITFTRKAAAEMRMRVYQALSSAKKEPPQDPHKLNIWRLAQNVLQRNQQMHWNLMANPNRLRIYTIDGLCNNLTRQMPIVSGFGAQPEIIEGVDATECYKKAINNLINTFPYSQSLENLLLHLDNDYQKTENLLINMLARRDQWLPHIMQDYDIETGLTNIINENIMNCERTLPSALCDELFTVVGQSWQKIAELLLTKNYKWRKNIINRYGLPPEEFRANLEALAHSPTSQYTEQQQNIINDFINVLKTLVAHLNLVFQEQGAVDYTAVSLAALEALGNEDNPTDLALKLDYKIQHILVDEFQDTSVSQYKLLKKLTAGWQPDDGRTLFLVGDPMQSIYKFREAKVGLFIRAKNHGINSIKLNSLTLSANFRSQKNLIDWVNQTFPRVFPQQENISTGAIPFIPSTAIHKPDKPLVQMHSIPNKDYDAEAQQIISIIQQTKTANPDSSIAILVRNRSHLDHILPTLQTQNITYKGVELETLGEKMIIQDIYSLTRALLNPLDRIAWLAILRAPWCGLKLADLHVLANADPDAPLWDVIANHQQLPQLTADAQQRLQYFVMAIHVGMNNHSPMYELPPQLIENTWIALNGPGCVTDKNDLQHAKKYFDLLREINANELDNKLSNLYADPDPNADDKLQIMTIHKAKGLEFDTVIIPGLNRKPRRKENDLLMWTERPNAQDQTTSDLIWAPIKAIGADHDPIYRWLQYEDAKKNDHETGRLLYVATTRAKQSLHLLANIDDKPNRGSLLEQLWPSWGGNRMGNSRPGVVRPVVHTLIRAKYLTPVGAIHEPPLVNEPPAFDSAQSSLPPEITAKNIGIVIHKCLEQIAMVMNPTSTPLQYNKLWRRQLIQLGTFNDLDIHTKTIETAINNTLQDPRGRWILDNNHQDAYNEYAITTTENNVIQHYVIDRTFIDNGIRWIIDYKTGNPDINQYREKLEKYAKAMRNLDNHPIKLGIYFPLSCEWHEFESILPA